MISFTPPERSHEEAQERFLILLKQFEQLLHPIRKFRLSCRTDHDGYIEFLDWIDYVIHRVSELYFSMRTDGEIYVLPACYVDSTSLVSLVLDGNINLFLEDFGPSEIIFPSLKNLELHINYVNLNVFLSGCPALETLRATLINFRTDETYVDPEAIRMPRPLKSLTFEEKYSHSEDVTLKHLEVNTPSLEYLRLRLRGCYKQILVCDYPNIKKACLDIFPKRRHVAWVPKLLRALCKTRFLRLEVSTTKCLLRARVIDLPDFCNLTQLQLDFYCFNSRLLIDLLHKCPKLQALKIYVVLESVNDNWCWSCLSSHKRSRWTRRSSVPNCIISHLNTVEYRGYQNTPDDYKFTAYILQRGLVLKTMRIQAKYHCRYSKCAFYEALSEIQRGSSMCRLEVE